MLQVLLVQYAASPFGTVCSKSFWYSRLQVLLVQYVASPFGTVCSKSFWYSMLQVLLVHYAASPFGTVCSKSFWYSMQQVLLVQYAASPPHMHRRPVRSLLQNEFSVGVFMGHHKLTCGTHVACSWTTLVYFTQNCQLQDVTTKYAE